MSKIAFLPQNYKAPVSSASYTKLQQGENKIRILSQPIVGWEDWINDKPMRYRMDEKPAKSHDPKKPIKHFWAFVIWNYEMECIQIMQITQATIRSSLEALCSDKDWGAPFFYDIKIIKKGEKVDTEYMVNPLPHKPIGDDVISAYKDKPCYLDSLFDGNDPFVIVDGNVTPGIFRNEELSVPKEKSKQTSISKDQADELLDILSECDEAYRKQVMKFIQSPEVNAKSLYDLPIGMYDRVRTAALKKRKPDPFAVGE